MSEKPKYAKLIEGADNLSLGVSIVAAILIGIALGWFMEDMFGYAWLFWLGVFWGVSAAILNIYKAYQKNVKSFDELKPDVRYKKYEEQQKHDETKRD